MILNRLNLVLLSLRLNSVQLHFNKRLKSDNNKSCFHCLIGRHIYNGFVALVSLFWLSSCAVANNQIGFDLSFDKPLSSECVERTFPQVKGISEIVTTSSGYNGFSLGGYEVGLFFRKIDDLVSGYQIKIDGMFQLESYDSFTRNAIELNRELREQFEEGCSG